MAPPMTAVQVAVLQRANTMRSRHGTILRAVRDGDTTVKDVFEQADHGDPAARGLILRTLLRAIPGVGAHTADKLLKDAGIHPSTGQRVMQVGAAQRAALLDRIPPAKARTKPRPPGPHSTPPEVSMRRAAAMRTRRRTIVQAVKHGETTVRDVFDQADHGDPAARGLTIRRLVLALRGVGPTLAEQWLTEARVGQPGRTVESIAPQHREHLLDLIQQQHPARQRTYTR